MNLKHLIIIVSNIIIVFLFSECKRDINEIYFDKFPKELILNGREIGPEDYFASPYLINQIDTFLFISDSKLFKKNGFFVYVVNVSSNEIIDSLFYHGDGPGEFNYIIDIKVDANKNLWVFDDIKKQLSYFNYSDIGNFKNLNQLYLPVNSFGMYKFCVINDTLFVGSGNLSDARLIFFNKNGNIVKQTGVYPINVDFDLGEAQMAYNYKNKKIILSYNLFDIIQIYDDGGRVLKTIKFKSNDNIKTKKMSNGEIQYKICYHSLVTTDNFLYALYAGKKMVSGDDSWKQGSFIQVFTLDGNPYCLYKLDVPIVAFAVDEANGVIYGINKFSNRPLMIFNLKDNV
jgi:hypothetical protein